MSNIGASSPISFTKDGWHIEYEQISLKALPLFSDAKLTQVPAHLGMSYQGRLIFRISANNSRDHNYEELACYQISEHVCMVCLREFNDLSTEHLKTYPMHSACLINLDVKIIENYSGFEYGFSPLEEFMLVHGTLFEAFPPWLLALPYMSLEYDKAAHAYEEDQDDQFVTLREDSMGNDISSGTARTRWTSKQPQQIPTKLHRILTDQQNIDNFQIIGNPIWVRMREYTYEHLGVTILGEEIWQLICECNLFGMPNDLRELIRFELSIGDQLQTLSPPIYFVTSVETQDQDDAQAFHASYTRGVPLKDRLAQ